MLGERLQRARTLAGLSQTALAQQLDLSTDMLKKYEQNSSLPGSDTLLKLAKIFNVQCEFFFRPHTVQLQHCHYLHGELLSPHDREKLEADSLEPLERYHELELLWPRLPIASFKNPLEIPDTICEFDELEVLSSRLRTAWRLGSSPIKNLVAQLENQGILVILNHADGYPDFAGLIGYCNERPVMVISSHWPGEHQRYTLAYLLAHLLLQGRIDEEITQERACHYFALSLLAPATAFYKKLGASRKQLNAQDLQGLKMEFGLSMLNCNQRAADLGIIDQRIQQKLHAAFHQQGWHKEEPGTAYAHEESWQLQRLVHDALSQGIIRESKAAELLGISVVKFHQLRQPELPDAPAH